jgi:mannose-6-phosphate isomerase
MCLYFDNSSRDGAEQRPVAAVDRRPTSIRKPASMTKLQLPPGPLCFSPLVKRALWGGRRLAELGKPLGDGADYAESWEIVDHGADQSTVIDGPWAGRTLGELTRNEGPALLGRHAPQSRFPLLFKFLDCRDRLSVQVHPNDTQAARLDPPDLGKTEAWVVLDALPGSKIYAGLKRGFDRHAFEREVARGTSELCLNTFEPRPGDCLFLPAGVVHAPGGGVLLAEIQQSSNATLRLYDWNRVGPDGKPRNLHIEAALNVIDYDYGPATPRAPAATRDPRVAILAACEKFVLERVELAAGDRWVIAGDGRFRILTVIGGTADVQGVRLARGATCLLPACLAETTIAAEEPATMLVSYLP